MYFVVVMDLYFCRIVGWSLDISMIVKLIKDVMKMVLDNWLMVLDLIVYFDWGV